MSLPQALPLTPTNLAIRAAPQAVPVTGASLTRRVSVIIPAYNDLKSLILCLKSLVATAGAEGMAGRMEILVQDDASPDVDLTEIIGPPAQVARNPRNLGFAGNCNAGASRAAGDVLFFLNQDTQAQPGWFEPLMAMFDNLQVGIVGPKLVFPPAPNGTGALPGLTAPRPPATAYSIQSCGGLYDGGKGPFHRYIGFAADDWRVNIAERVSWTTGAALAVRRDLFEKVSGFDAAYGRGYFEDVDLCEKVKERGYEVWYCPEAVFTHKVGTSNAETAESFRANSLRFHERWDRRITPDTNIIHVNY